MNGCCWFYCQSASVPQQCNDQKGRHWADPPVNCVLSILYFLLCVLFYVLYFDQKYVTWLALMRCMDKHRLVGPIHWRWSMLDWGAISGVVEAPVVDDHYCHLWQDCTPPSPLCKSTNSARWLKRAVVSSGRHTSRLTSDDTQRNLCQPINKTLVDEEEDIDKELDNEVDEEVDTSSSTNQQNTRGQGGGHHALLVRHVLFDIQAQYRDQQITK